MMTALTRRVYAALERRKYRWLNQSNRHIALEPGTVSFTFDDFPASAANEGARLLEQQGWRGTFYLATGLIDKESSVGLIVGLTDIDRLYRDGHEIGSHTHSHMNCQSASKSALLGDLQLSRETLANFNAARHFAFPFGAYDNAALNVLNGRYESMRTIQPGINRGSVDMNQLKANSIYESSDLADLHALTEEVRKTGGWLIFYTHDVRAEPSDFGCTEGRFQSVVDFVKEAGLTVRTVGETVKLLTSSV